MMIRRSLIAGLMMIELLAAAKLVEAADARNLDRTTIRQMPVVERPYRFVAVGHRPRIDRPPFGAVPPEPSPGEDRLPLHRDPRPGLRSFGAFGLGEAGQRDETAPAASSQVHSPWVSTGRRCC